MSSSPLAPLLPQILASLKKESSKPILLEAQPGAGKTTEVPYHLWCKQSLPIYCLQPRRSACKSLTNYLHQRGTKERTEIAYQVRQEDTTTPQSRLIYTTYGSFLQRSLNQGFFQAPKVLIFDEIHERSWEMDFLIALYRHQPQTPTLFMSATLSSDFWQEVLGPKHLHLCAQGTLYPVTISYHPLKNLHRQSLEIAEHCHQILTQNPLAQILVFLESKARINQTFRECQKKLSPSITLQILHGQITLQEQSTILATSRPQRVILSTNIAETSLTIPGITHVIDSGQEKKIYQDQLGTPPSLLTTRCSQFSSQQRAGRAGRLQKGHCLRLFSHQDYQDRPLDHPPSILESDLSAIALHCLAHGRSPLTMAWPSPPDPDSWEKAIHYLQKHRCLTPKKQLTPKAESLLSLGSDLSIALFLWELKSELCLHQLTNLWLKLEKPSRQPCWLEENSLSQRSQDPYYRKKLKRISPTPKNNPDPLASIAKAWITLFPQLIAQKTSDESAKLALGGDLLLPKTLHDLKKGDLFACLFPLATQPKRYQGNLFIPIRTEDLWEYALEQLDEQSEFTFEPSNNKVLKRTDLKLGTITLESQRQQATLEQSRPFYLREILDNQSRLYQDFKFKLNLIERFQKNWLDPFLTSQQLCEATLKEFLAHHHHWPEICQTLSSDQVFYYLPQKLTCRKELLQTLLEFPQAVSLPRRKRCPILYQDQGLPILRSRLQDFLGLKEPLTLTSLKIPLEYHLLAPNQRLIQKTSDILGFWQGSYHQIRKDLRGRYPKHDWPENP